MPAFEKNTLAAFLALLERDIAERPEALVPLNEDLLARMAAAIEGVRNDPNVPILGDAPLAPLWIAAPPSGGSR